jgi:hypothetical protein
MLAQTLGCVRQFGVVASLGQPAGRILLLGWKSASEHCVISTSQEGVLSPAQRMEWEANRFSAHLLLPTQLVSRSLQRIRHFDLTHLLALANDFGTSKEFTAIRYADFADDPCCFVMSHDGVVRRVYRMPSFPRLRVWRGDPVPPRSNTIRASGEVGSVSGLDEVDSAEWVETQYDEPTPGPQLRRGGR